MFQDNHEIDSKMDFKNVFIFSNPSAELSKYAKLAKNLSNLGSFNPNRMNFENNP
ncbi:MAG: hypothetical protein KatS3mg068_2196 [Candidatus Sericytochromatia bacterium]|nr:MAG: hypothetical protein KatS3mg068_2196 [Candidatus Sericytochromatia bacterium]